jgi:hypothetical protein
VSDEAEEFFYAHAGWGYLPGSETPERGRRRGAEALAEAEGWAADVEVEYSWSDDFRVDHVAEYDCYDEEPATCETCTAELGMLSESLGCIDDADDNYRRVIMAELAIALREQVESLAWAVEQ